MAKRKRSKHFNSAGFPKINFKKVTATQGRINEWASTADYVPERISMPKKKDANIIVLSPEVAAIKKEEPKKPRKSEIQKLRELTSDQTIFVISSNQFFGKSPHVKMGEDSNHINLPPLNCGKAHVVVMGSRHVTSSGFSCGFLEVRAPILKSLFRETSFEATGGSVEKIKTNMKNVKVTGNTGLETMIANSKNVVLENNPELSTYVPKKSTNSEINNCPKL